MTVTTLGPAYGLFPPKDLDSDSDLNSDSKPYCIMHIVLCTTFSTDSDLDSDPHMDSFPNGYCTHFRDRSPSLFHTFESGDQSPNPNQWKNPA